MKSSLTFPKAQHPFIAIPCPTTPYPAYLFGHIVSPLVNQQSALSEGVNCQRVLGPWIPNPCVCITVVFWVGPCFGPVDIVTLSDHVDIPMTTFFVSLQRSSFLPQPYNRWIMFRLPFPFGISFILLLCFPHCVFFSEVS